LCSAMRGGLSLSQEVLTIITAPSRPHLSRHRHLMAYHSVFIQKYHE
jgi:hypothetical protein